jgi:hypothetical protein
MQSAIVFISQPSDPSTLQHEQERAWRGIENTVPQILEKAKHGERLSEGTWLIPLHGGSGGLETILKMIEVARQLHCPYRVLLVEGELNWLA